MALNDCTNPRAPSFLTIWAVINPLYTDRMMKRSINTISHTITAIWLIVLAW